jgi:hypothetical protein
MNPYDPQSIANAYQQAADVSAHFKFLIYSAEFAIIICALFSVLIFWKLCQIHKQLAANAASQSMPPSSQEPASAATPAPPAVDDSRYLPKS